ncbi:diacylglycerol kinase [Marinithermofilum abyssi]|uniref:Diacylglycerol kinase n=1 Tax=Marinithermofilum abyssi TaxID=1571185 RepID=A0A8J2YA49_9BACL|nr:diacylglycerol kinase family protein [Marinithermofilum abyssi]GGE06018.1 diacylglycerol kinase [Marinithermofilum abyssi]
MFIVIVNPVSGNGKGVKIVSPLEKELKRKQVPYEIRWTQYPGHASKLAEEASRRPEVKAVVAVGGDGTVHEVANGLAGTDIPLGYVPAGSGNDFARAHGIPRHPLKALERILKGEPFTVDTAACGERVLVNTAGIGFDGEVAKWVNQSRWKKWLGKFAYVLGVIRVLRRFTPRKVWLTVDGQEHVMDGVWLIAIANIPYYGGGMKICPEASNQDGILDICLVHNISRPLLLALFPRVFQGTHVRHPAAKMMKGKEIRIQSDHPMVIHVDGEIVGETPCKVTLRPQSLRVL